MEEMENLKLKLKEAFDKLDKVNSKKDLLVKKSRIKMDRKLANKMMQVSNEYDDVIKEIRNIRYEILKLEKLSENQ